MAYIQVPDHVPGIRSLVLFSPETGKHLYDLAQALLRGNSILSAAEKELIAAYVSNRNNCLFCMSSHAAAARCLYGDAAAVVDQVLDNMTQASISEKLKALLHIAGQTQQSGLAVTENDIQFARKSGATDEEIHDAVLISATFSMFNRYVDGLNSFTPTDPAEYVPMGIRMAEKGYVPPTAPVAQ
ncbi:carboxymuconolactone decarboxylase family protein [Deminuibacter soli]|uniref:Carboxymuconolactone decarboxylase n=1 Tax=Deminuibacter soli TaxID=2291815 RepID=A0A3E1NGS0_9BACT|nr:peroxidase-related enzyme [Deminuibacter soli]RFM27156.1 carboxymuconolactone decarboxylase [Deminuibacter soli]